VLLCYLVIVTLSLFIIVAYLELIQKMSKIVIVEGPPGQTGPRGKPGEIKERFIKRFFTNSSFVLSTGTNANFYDTSDYIMDNVAELHGELGYDDYLKIVNLSDESKILKLTASISGLQGQCSATFAFYESTGTGHTILSDARATVDFGGNEIASSHSLLIDYVFLTQNETKRICVRTVVQNPANISVLGGNYIRTILAEELI